MRKVREHAGVIAPPPLVALLTVVGGLVLDRFLPLGWLTLVPPGVRYPLAVVLTGLAGWLAWRAISAFRRAGTPVEPWKPTTTLVTAGIYAKTRNPMYLGLGLLLLGLALALASDWTVVGFVLFVLVLHHGVVLREEAYLQASFGSDYRRYKADVPRYGWRFSNPSRSRRRK